MDNQNAKKFQNLAEEINSVTSSYSNVIKIALYVTAVFIIIITFFGVKAYHVLHRPVLNTKNLQANTKINSYDRFNNVITLKVEKGDVFNDIKRKLNVQNSVVESIFLTGYLKITKKDKSLQAGYYEFTPKTNLVEVIDKISTGDVKINKFQISDGVTTDHILKALKNTPNIVLTLPYNSSLTSEKLANILSIPHKSTEGLFFPDTYYYQNGESDKDILLKAYNNMQEKLKLAWNNKDNEKFNKFSKKYINNSYDVLRLAAIVEKEAGDKLDREKVAGVFLLRLNKNMRLQSDPTVIYSIRDDFKGDLKKHHLKFQSPYNTYVVKGLPPTPISTVSLESINAVLHPNVSEDLFFVASGDGKTHVFSKNIEQHNALVKKILLK